MKTKLFPALLLALILAPSAVSAEEAAPAATPEAPTPEEISETCEVPDVMDLVLDVERKSDFPSCSERIPFFTPCSECPDYCTDSNGELLECVCEDDFCECPA